LEHAAIQFLLDRDVIAPSSPESSPKMNNHAYELVGDGQSGGTKQEAGSLNLNYRQTDESPSAPEIYVQKASDLFETSQKHETGRVFAVPQPRGERGTSPQNRAKKRQDDVDNWQATDGLTVSEEIQNMPQSDKSTKFIQSLRESILNAGITESIVKAETAQLTERRDDAQLSGEWHSVEGQVDENGAPVRPVLPPAALRKKKLKQPVEPVLSLEERLDSEDIHAKEFEEEERIRLKQLKDKTTGGQYHLYLLVYAACVILAFTAQRFLPADLLHATNTAGHSVTSAVNRLMLPTTFNSFTQGLRFYEDETTRGTIKRGGSTVASIAAGWDAAVKVATSDAPATLSKTRRSWFQLPTGFILGWPAAALYSVHQIFVQAVANKSALELVLTGLMYLSVIGISTMAYLIIQRQAPVLPLIAAPVVIGLLVSVTSIFIGAVMTVSDLICKQLMPDTTQLFTALAIIAVSLISSRMALLAPQSHTRGPESSRR
jgi:hypothetical protein